MRRLVGGKFLAWMALANVLVAFCLHTPASLRAGEFNRVLHIGKPAPHYETLPGIDGEQHSMKDLSDKEVLVVVFTCNSCAYAVDYEDRIIAFAKQYSEKESKVALVAINVNTIAADRLDKMKKRAEEKQFPFPYLYDESGKIAEAFGAVRTPEFYVLDKNRRVMFMGAMDDKPNPAEKPQRHYVQEAVDAILAGKPVATSEIAPVGCLFRFARARRNP